MCGHDIQQSTNQLHKVANPVYGQLNREKNPCPRSRLRIWFRETGLAVPSLVSLLILYTNAESGAYSRYSSRIPRRRPLFLPAPHTIGSVPSLSGHAIAYRLRSLPRVRWHRASSPQVSSSNGCCLCITMDQMLLCSSLFPHSLLIYSENVQIIGCIHKIRLHGRRGKGMAESFSRQKSRHAPQKEGGLKILCDLPPV